MYDDWTDAEDDEIDNEYDQHSLSRVSVAMSLSYSGEPVRGLLVIENVDGRAPKNGSSVAAGNLEDEENSP
jgi:hypothetical protein